MSSQSSHPVNYLHSLEEVKVSLHNWVCSAERELITILSWLQQHVNWELPDVQAGFRKGRGTRDQIAKIFWIRKTSTSALLTTPKPLNVWTTTNYGKILQEMGIPEHLTCLLRNLYAGQEATVRARHGTVDWYQIGKGVCQGCILSPCLFNLFAESVQLSLVVLSCSTLCNPMNRSTPGLPVHHQLPEFTQTHVHWVSDAIQTSPPLLSPSSPTFNLSKHQGLFKRVSS